MLLSFIITTPYITPFHTTPHHIISHNITLHFTSHNTPFVTTLFSLLHTPTTPTPPPLFARSYAANVARRTARFVQESGPDGGD